MRVSDDTLILGICALVVITTGLVAAATPSPSPVSDARDYCETTLGVDSRVVWVVEDDNHELACQHPDGTIIDIPAGVTN
jgi:hypothetical protein